MTRIHSSALRLASLLIITATVHATAFAAEQQASWNGHQIAKAWRPNSQVKFGADSGQVVLHSTGRDPYVSTSVNLPTGWHQIEIQAAFVGRADLQLFWATAKSGFSEAQSVRESFSGGVIFGSSSKKKMRLHFRTDAPVTALRLDPFSRKGKMQITSIVITDDEPPRPTATQVSDMTVADGFQVELLHSVDAEQHGSWVSMTEDPKGRLIVSDQYGKLHRVTPPALGSDAAVSIETIDLEIGMAQGLLYAFDSLYVMVNGTEADERGLYRVTDSNGDDQLDQVQFLRKLDGGGEHGPHAIILSPDGKSLYVCAGNHTDPTQFSSSRVPQVWQEDQLLPRMWDAGGHAVGRMAPGGWIAKVSPDGEQWELVACGFRNEYDIAFSARGELFTYDADMEWDVGTPWYRPTRVNHVISGGEFGWRSGTGKWPEYYPDSLPAAVDIGPGSPTGIVFGTGAKFPAKFQQALYICDWSYGVIYAVHLTADGATWKGTAEPFISAAPLPATDLLVAKDGALYFTIGGRRTQSGLYRVTYTGKEDTTPAIDGGHSDLREVRQKLEALHTPDAKNAVEEAWPYLGHRDRYIRYAARIAVEHQPVLSWADRALLENSSPDASINALLALARHGDASLQPTLMEALGRLRTEDLTERQLLDALRVVQLAFIRMGEPTDELRERTAKVLSPLYPADSQRLNRELCALLVYLQTEDVAAKTLTLIEQAETQEEQLWYALCLRALESHWTIEQREAYFEWFLQAAAMRGGHSFSGFLNNIRNDAIERLNEAEQLALKDLLEKKPAAAEPEIAAKSRPFVKKWTVQELLSDVESGLEGRDLKNGSQMFTLAGCYKCHRFGGRGGIVGPDLTAVGRRFNSQALLESLLEPSKVVSDQYEATVFVTEDGKQIVGRVVNLNGDRIMVSENMLDPGRLTTVRTSEIEETFTSKTSMMPAGLLDNLTRDEVLDLLAYLKSGASGPLN